MLKRFLVIGIPLVVVVSTVAFAPRFLPRAWQNMAQALIVALSVAAMAMGLLADITGKGLAHQ